jgi:hypothetical protein
MATETKQLDQRFDHTHRFAADQTRCYCGYVSRGYSRIIATEMKLTDKRQQPFDCVPGCKEWQWYRKEVEAQP